MTPKISLIIGVAAAALAVGVPTAFADGRYTDSHERSGAVATTQNASPDWFERAAAAAIRDANGVAGYRDGGERTLVVQQPTLAGYSDAGARSGPIVSPPEVSVSADTGSGLEWPELGIGFGFGILLAVGLFLAMRMTKVRPLAH